MAEATQRESWTWETLRDRTDIDPNRYEIVDGELVDAEKALSLLGGGLWARLCAALSPHVEANQLGLLCNHGRFLIRDQPRTERRPDLAFVRRERLPERPYPELFPGAPDLVIEILSPSDTLRRKRERVRAFLEAGAHEVWMVDEAAEAIVVYRPGAHPRSYSHGDTLESPELLPGFQLELAGLFD